MMNDTSLGFLSYQDEKYTYSSSSSDHFESQQFLLEICIMKGEERVVFNNLLLEKRWCWGY
jgi:hypothetical protein